MTLPETGPTAEVLQQQEDARKHLHALQQRIARESPQAALSPTNQPGTP